MSFLNSVTLVGNLGKNPEVLKVSKNGKFVRLNLATTKVYYKDNDEKVERTEWHTVHLNSSSAEFAATYLQTGDKVMIVGELRTSQWDDKDGITRYSTSVFGSECRSLMPKPESKSQSKENPRDRSRERA